jgi:hypothetical protein
MKSCYGAHKTCPASPTPHLSPYDILREKNSKKPIEIDRKKNLEKKWS